METVALRNKWRETITKVDDKFLRMLDALHESYIKNELDFFDELPKEIQNLLLESSEDIKNGKFFSHEQVMNEAREKYNIAK